MVNIAYVSQEDKKAVYDLWQSCFGDPKAFADFYFEYIFRQNKVLGLFDEEGLSSMIHLNPYELWIEGKSVSSVYIVGVATKEKKRHQGMMRSLLKQMFADLYSQRMPFAYLMPADEQIYLPFDFQWIYRQFVMEKKKTHRKQWPIDSKPIGYRTANAKDNECLSLFSNQILEQNYQMFAKRDVRYFENLRQSVMAEHGDILMLFEGDQLIGYVAYMIGEQVEINELLCLPEYTSEVLRWVCNHYNEETAKILAMPMKMTVTIKEPSIENCYYKPIIMARIVCLEEMLLLCHFKQESGTILLKVSDRLISQNEGVYKMDIEDHKAVKVTHTPLKKDEAETLDIGLLTRQIFGYLHPDDTEPNIFEALDQIFLNEIV